MKTLAMALLLSGCASTHVLPLGHGQYLATREESGGSPSEGDMMREARDAAAKQCGSLENVHFLSEESNATYAPGLANNHGHASMRFECTGPNVQQDPHGRPL